MVRIWGNIFIVMKLRGLVERRLYFLFLGGKESCSVRVE